MAPLDSNPAPETPLSVRTLFLSDVHLGQRDCKAEALLELLRTVKCERLILAGDIVDLWAMSRSWYWPESHNTVVQKILRMARHGTRVVYVPGNHDSLFRQYAGLEFGGIRIATEVQMRLANGRRVWVTHGDQFDTQVRCGGVLRFLGHHGYDLLLRLNRGWNHLRHWRGLPYWSLAEFIKRRLSTARVFIDRYEQAVAETATARSVDVVVCGHIHRPVTKRIGPVIYANTGDWVENRTALVEHLDGELELLSAPVTCSI